MTEYRPILKNGKLTNTKYEKEIPKKKSFISVPDLKKEEEEKEEKVKKKVIVRKKPKD